MTITASLRFAARLVPLVLFLTSCVDAPSAPEGSSTPGARFIVAPVFSLVGPQGSGPLTAPQASALDDAFDLVDNFRMVVTRIPSGQVAQDTIISVTPGQDEYDLSVTVTINGASEQFSVLLTARQGSLELFTADPFTVTATSTIPGAGAPPPTTSVTMRYSGPGATATSMVLSPAQAVLAPDGTVQLTASVLDDSGVAIAGVPLAWSSTSASVASVNPTGLATASGQGVTEIVASTPTGLQAKTWVYVVGGTLAYVQGGVVNVRAPAGGDAQAKSSGGAASGPTWAGGDLYYAEGGVVQKAGSAATLLHASWPSVSPDGGMIAGDAGGTVVFANIDGTNETEGPSGTTPIWTDWSTLVVGGGSIQQVQADGSARSTLVSGDASLPAFSSSGTLAYVSGGKLMVQGRADALADVGGRPSWSPDGAWIVAPGGGGLLLIPTGSAAPPVALPGLDGASDPAWKGTSFGGGSPPALSLTRLDPDPAMPGQEVSIVGTGFDWIILKNNKVFWPGADGTITGEVLSVSKTALRSIMPRGVVAGQIRVENRQGQALLEFVPRLGSIEIHAKTPWDAAVGGVGIKILDSTGAEAAAGSTDQDGTYAADALFPGTYTINITAPTGFTLTGDASRSLTITAAVSTLDLTLRPAVAKVTISPDDLTLGVFDEVGVSVTPLDINGDVVPDIGSISWSGSARLDAWDGGLNTTIVGRQPSAKAGDAGFSVTLDGKSFGFGATVTSSIGGTVTKGEDQAKIQGLSITLLQGDKELATTFTDNAGRYSFPGLLAGTYVVTPAASAEGTLSPTSATVTLGSSNPIGTANFSVGSGGGAQRRAGNVVIYKDYDAWGSTKEESTLTGFGLTKGTDFFVQPSADLKTEIPASTSLIILTSLSGGSGPAANVNSAEAQANLDAWVRGGGFLLAHLADNVYAGTGYVIPGLTGQVDEINVCDGLTFAVADHPLRRGLDGVLGTSDDLDDDNVDVPSNCYDNHGSLAGVLPAGAEVLLIEQGGMERPVYAVYSYGAGTVVVTTMTLEWGGNPARNMTNHLWWTVMGGQAPPAAPPGNQALRLVAPIAVGAIVNSDVPVGGGAARLSPDTSRPLVPGADKAVKKPRPPGR